MEAKTVKSNMTDMTQGSPARLILFFALPLLVGNMFQQLYNMVDSIVVGRFVGSTALAAVGTAFPVVFLLSSMFMGLGIGAMVMVSQFYGAGDAERLTALLTRGATVMVCGGDAMAEAVREVFDGLGGAGPGRVQALRRRRRYLEDIY